VLHCWLDPVLPLTFRSGQLAAVPLPLALAPSTATTASRSISMLQGKNTPLSDVAKQFSEMREAGFRIHPWP